MEKDFDNEVVIVFKRKYFEDEFKLKLTDTQWSFLSEWMEQQCEENVWNKAMYYINDWLEDDIESFYRDYPDAPRDAPDAPRN